MSAPIRDREEVRSAFRALAGPSGGALALIARARQSVANGWRASLDKLRTSPAPAQVVTPAGLPTETSLVSAFAGRAFLWSFILMVLAPTIASAFYFLLIASNQYVSETRLTVRAATQLKDPQSDQFSLLSKIGIGGAQSTIQDSYLVLNYVKSRTIVADIGGRDYMESRFSGPGVDWISRLSHGLPDEDLWKYWTYHVVPVIDTLSGIVTIKVYAFSADDALDISKRVIDLSDQLINKVSERSRAAALDEAGAELDRARKEMADAGAALQTFRNQTTDIDPAAHAASVGEMMGKLLVERNEIENNLLTFGNTLASNAPTVRIQKDRMAALDKQLADLKQQLTSTSGAGAALADNLAKFERLKLDEQFAAKKLETAEQAFDRAKLDYERKKLFVSLVVPPQLPQYPLFPEAGVDILLAFAICFTTWGILCLISASVLDHMI